MLAGPEIAQVVAEFEREFLDDGKVVITRSHLADIERLDIVWEQYFPIEMVQEDYVITKPILKRTDLLFCITIIIKENYFLISDQIEKIDIIIYTIYLNRECFQQVVLTLI